MILYVWVKQSLSVWYVNHCAGIIKVYLWNLSSHFHDGEQSTVLFLFPVLYNRLLSDLIFINSWYIMSCRGCILLWSCQTEVRPPAVQTFWLWGVANQNKSCPPGGGVKQLVSDRKTDTGPLSETRVTAPSNGSRWKEIHKKKNLICSNFMKHQRQKW